MKKQGMEWVTLLEPGWGMHHVKTVTSNRVKVKSTNLDKVAQEKVISP